MNGNHYTRALNISHSNLDPGIPFALYRKVMSKHAKRLLPFAVLIVMILIVYIADLHNVLSIDWLRQEHLHLKEDVAKHPFLSPLIYMGVYVLSVCLVIPDSTILTLLAGFVFPLPLALLYAVASELIGAVVFFQVFSSVFRLPGLRLDRPFVHKIKKEFRSHPIVYMLFLRVSHIIPFWMTNVVAAYFRVKLWNFTWTTFLGVIPLTYILADAGSSLSKLFAEKTELSVSDIFTVQVKLALIVTGVLFLIPLIYKRFFRRKS